ncbi:MAG: glycolate oxidase subunit GlcE, partial [Rhodoferax sp.]
PVLSLPWPQLVEWHGGLRWVWAPVDAGAQLQAVAGVHGGHATLFVAPGAVSTGDTARFATQNPALMAIQRRLKDTFDPQGIFGPGRLFDFSSASRHANQSRP